jgi:DNA-binding HxlR family transcriptional regulator
MRPEYALTPAGEELGPVCIKATEVVPALGITEVALKKWPMLVVVAIGRGGAASADQDLLPGITAGANGALRDLQASGLADRTITESWPPHTIYELTPLALQALPVLEEVCATAERIEPRMASGT